MMNPESQTKDFRGSSCHHPPGATHEIANIINVQRPNPEAT